MSGARRLRQAFGDRARMVTADKGGHLAYLFKANTCLNGTVTTFPATGQRPENDVVCAAESASSGR
ncbi:MULTISPECIES: alpha/beta hydrolase [Nocardia]|uniref:alpha/beta hydrolase n=1 Tax=Nocardia TaxID=1817 RepID=UPI0022B83572|nr:MULTISPECIES: alpha/beta hydrolase [Nocardia]